MADTAQINVRIGADLKARGDAALQAAGITPSEAARALWKFAADHELEPQAIVEEIARLGGTLDAIGEEKRRRLDAYGKARSAFSDRMAGLGVPCESRAAQPEASVDELREEALFERMAERGLL